MLHYKGRSKLKYTMHRNPKFVFENKRKISQSKTYTFVKLNTIEGDLYNGIPIYNTKDSEFPSYIVENGVFGLVEGKILNDKMCKVTIMEENCDICEGYIKSGYLCEIKTIGENKAKNYNKFYSVISDNGANIRSKAEILENNIIKNIPRNTYVLANGNMKLYGNGEGMWTPIMYIDEENKVIEGYIEKSELEEKRASEIEAMYTNTERGISTLKEAPSIYSNAITELENGKELYAISTSKEIIADNITWKPVIYFNTEKNIFVSGWIDARNLTK